MSKRIARGRRCGCGRGVSDSGPSVNFARPDRPNVSYNPDGDTRPALYLMCQGLEDTLAPLEAAGAVRRGPIGDQGWGRVTMLEIPGGVELGLYEPRHTTALQLAAAKARAYRHATD